MFVLGQHCFMIAVETKPPETASTLRARQTPQRWERLYANLVELPTFCRDLIINVQNELLEPVLYFKSH